MRAKHSEQDGKTFATKAQIKELLRTLEDVDEEHRNLNIRKALRTVEKRKKTMMMPKRPEENPIRANADY